MKKYTHGLLTMLALKRLELASIPAEDVSNSMLLVSWFKNYRDDVLKGSWYPDEVIKDMATSHVLKYMPDPTSSECRFKTLPDEYHLFEIGKRSQLYKKPYTIKSGNLADRCEALAHSVVDNLKMQRSEEKGSPISPTNNHVAAIFFMLSHYIADSHMPLHCDARSFSSNADIHGHIEKNGMTWLESVTRLTFKTRDSSMIPMDFL